MVIKSKYVEKVNPHPFAYRRTLAILGRIADAF
jgi:hypothetical protein